MRTSTLKLFGSKLPAIDSNAPLRWKSIARHREIIKVKNDIENGTLEGEQIWIPELCGTHEKRISFWLKIINAFKQCLP